MPENNRRKTALLAFLLSFLTAGLFILPQTVASGVFSVGSDYVQQIVPFWSHANEALKSGDIFWSDTLDLGSQFIGSFSYYALGSPFFWLSLLIPGRWFYLFGGLLLALKYGVAGMTAFLYLRRYTETDAPALIASLLYAFSGFQISNQNFYLFADVAALFPLVLLAMDAAMERDRRFVFAPAVGALALCSWFSLFGAAVFLALYLLVKWWCGDYRMTGRRFFRLVSEGLLGVGLGAVLLLPSVLFNLSNPRASAVFESAGQMLLIKPFYLADFLRGLLLPPECGFSRAFLINGVFNGGELYLPLFGIVPALAYFFCNRKRFETRLSLICLVFMLIPVLNSLFVALNAEYYTRWFYMPSLILCLATAKAIEQRELPLKRGWIGYAAVLLISVAVAAVFLLFTEVPVINDLPAAAVFAGFAAAGLAVTALLRRIQRLRRGNVMLTAAVMLFSAGIGFWNISLMHRCFAPGAPADLFTARETVRLPEGETYARADADGYHFYNIGTAVGFPSMDSFTSTVSGSVFDFYDFCNEPRSVISSLADDRFGYRAFLSVRYWIRYGTTGDSLPGWEPHGAAGGFRILENRHYIPLGYTYGGYVSEEKFSLVDDSEKHLALVKALVLSPEQAARYRGMLPEMTPEIYYNLTWERFEEDVAARRAESAHLSEKTNSGYRAEIRLFSDNLVFFSIPWDAGWRAEVNGEPAVIERVMGGFFAVPCGAGENEIVLTYRPPGLAAGAGITGCSAMILFFSVLLPRFIRTKSRAGQI